MVDLSGQIDAAEIQHSLHTIGVSISLEDATRILQRSANVVFQYLTLHLMVGNTEADIFLPYCSQRRKD